MQVKKVVRVKRNADTSKTSGGFQQLENKLIGGGLHSLDMGKKRFDHRFLACVARGKCVEGVELPVINPAENVVEGRIDASRKPRKSLAHKQKVVKQMRISDDRIIDAFEKWRRTAGKPARKAGLLAGEGENSVDMALKMLRDKARLREVNKLGAELEDIKDRMVNVRRISCFSFKSTKTYESSRQMCYLTV